MDDGEFTSLDNRRLFVARCAKIPIPCFIHQVGEMLPKEL